MFLSPLQGPGMFRGPPPPGPPMQGPPMGPPGPPGPRGPPMPDQRGPPSNQGWERPPRK